MLIGDVLILRTESDGFLSIEALKLPAKVRLHPAVVTRVLDELGLRKEVPNVL